MNNQVAMQQGKPKFSAAIQSEGYKKLVNNTLGDPQKAGRFIASISSAVAINPSLQECDAGSILSAGLLGEALELSPSPQLGQYYLVPFKKKMKDQNGNEYQISTAQFQLGYKGYIQLAIRSGQYADIDAKEVREGEYLGLNSITGKPMFKWIEDDSRRMSLPVVGYMAYFETLNGFTKVLYWSKDKMEQHADKYSQAFNLDTYNKIKTGKIDQKDMWKYSSYWYKDFDGMAYKTMLRQLISKWGIMSIQMQTAMEKDMATIKEDGTYEYIETDENLITGEILEETITSEEVKIEHQIEKDTKKSKLNEI